MEKKKEVGSALSFIDYVVNNVEFIYNEEFREDEISIDFDIDKEVNFVDDDPNTILVTLYVKIFDDPKINNYPFSMKLTVTGIFKVKDTDEIVQRDSLIEVNAVAILFPYVRSLVTTYTSNSNVPPLILPPINVVKLFRNKKEQ